MTSLSFQENAKNMYRQKLFENLITSEWFCQITIPQEKLHLYAPYSENYQYNK